MPGKREEGGRGKKKEGGGRRGEEGGEREEERMVLTVKTEVWILPLQLLGIAPESKNHVREDDDLVTSPAVGKSSNQQEWDTPNIHTNIHDEGFEGFVW